MAFLDKLLSPPNRSLVSFPVQLQLLQQLDLEDWCHFLSAAVACNLECRPDVELVIIDKREGLDQGLPQL